MKRKMIIGSILAVLMLVAISCATAVNTDENAGTKESPLYKIRNTRTTTERIKEVIYNIKTRFIGERALYLPIKWLTTMSDNDSATPTPASVGHITYCAPIFCK